MKRVFFTSVLILLVSLAVLADDIVLAEGLKDKNQNVRVAQALSFRTIVYVWEYEKVEEKVSDIKMLVIKYNKKGKVSSKKVVTLSSAQRAERPNVAYNPETKRFLVTWIAWDKGEHTVVMGQVINARGGFVDKPLVVLDDGQTLFSYPASVPLLSKAHNGQNRGDFLTSAFNNAWFPVNALAEVNSRSRAIFRRDIPSSGTRFISDMAVSESGEILMAGTDFYPYTEFGVLSFRLGDSKAKYTKLSNVGYTVFDLRFVFISSKTCLLRWYDGHKKNDRHLFALVGKNGVSSKGPQLSGAVCKNRLGNFLVASNGKIYSASRGDNSYEIVLNTYNSKAKYTSYEKVTDRKPNWSNELHVLELARLNKLLILYHDVQNKKVSIKGHIHQLND